MQNPPMHLHRDWRGLPASARGATVAMGNFDGVHLGHRAVIDAARAACPDAPLGAVTFEPHPREYFARAAGRSEPPFRLMNPEARANRLARHGVAQLYELPFGPTLAGLTPEEFAREVLAEGLSEDGFAASARPVPGAAAIQLCQGHCPVQSVAAEFPELCEAEARAFSRMLGVHVQRLATLAHGGHVCTTNIPIIPVRPDDAAPTPVRTRKDDSA